MADGEYKFEQYQGDEIKALLDKLVTLVGNDNIVKSLATLINEAVSAEAVQRVSTDNSLGDAIEVINAKIPSAARPNNQLADKGYVDNQISSVRQSLNTAIEQEETRAKGVEAQLGSALDTETSERQTAINAMNVTKTVTSTNGLSFTIRQVNGKITEVSLSLSTDSTPSANSTKAVTSAGVKSYVDEKTAAAETNKLGTVKLYNSSGTNRSGLQIENGALLVYALSEYGLYRSDDGKLVANLRRSATSSDIAKVGTEQAVDYAAITTANLVEAVEKVSDVTGETITEADLDELFPLNS